MFQRAVIIPSHILSHYSNLKLIQAFEARGLDFGWGRWRLWWNMRTLQSLAKSYNLGALSSEQFYTQVMNCFPQTDMDQWRFFEAWNSAVSLNQEQISVIEQLISYANQNKIYLCITANSNEAHINTLLRFLPEKLQAFFNKYGVFSYKEKTLDTANTAIDKAIDLVGQDNVVLVLKVPKVTWNPLASFFYQQAVSVLNQLTTLAADKKIKHFDLSWDLGPQQPNLLEQIEAVCFSENDTSADDLNFNEITFLPWQVSGQPAQERNGSFWGHGYYHRVNSASPAGGVVGGLNPQENSETGPRP